MPFVWLLFFWTRRYQFYDHTVFVTYSLAFMSLLAVVLTDPRLRRRRPAGRSLRRCVFVPPIHMFRQLKQAYRLHWASALLRTFILLHLLHDHGDPVLRAPARHRRARLKAPAWPPC